MPTGSERMIGKGKVFKEQQFIADIQYEVQINSHYKNSESTEGGEYLSSKTVDVRIIPPSAVSGYLGDKLTLHLSDGRKKQDFHVISGTGNCKGTGGPYE